MAAAQFTPDILAFGEPMVEFNQTGQGAGRLYLQGFGGDTSNFAIAAARQGAPGQPGHADHGADHALHTLEARHHQRLQRVLALQHETGRARLAQDLLM